MDSTLKDFSPIISSKFIVPEVDPEKLVIQRSLLDDSFFDKLSTSRIVFIEALAGAGKSVFAQQYIMLSDKRSGWYQVTLEDCDPVTFLTNLSGLLEVIFPHLFKEEILQSIKSGVVHPLEVIDYGRLLWKNIKVSDNEDHVVIIDDLHIILSSKHSINLLKSLINFSPKWLQWILISRENDQDLRNLLDIDDSSVRIDNTHLAFQANDIAMLYNNINNKSLTTNRIKNILEMTEGWVMGVVLCANDPKLQLLNKLTPENIPSSLKKYFFDNVLSSQSPKLCKFLFKLLLLDEIELRFITTLTEDADCTRLLEDLVKAVPFIRSSNRNRDVYTFHHLFLSTLRTYAEEELSVETKDSVLKQATKFYLDDKNQEVALKYASRCSDFSTLEQAVNECAFDLISTNRISTLVGYLELFSEKELLEKPWLCLYYGACIQEINPSIANKYYEASCKKFILLNDKVGELYARCQLTTFSIVILGVLKKAIEHVKIIEDIYNDISCSLPLHIKVRALYSLAEGYCYVLSDITKASIYLESAIRICLKNNISNVLCLLIVMKNTMDGFNGNWDRFAQNVEEYYYLTNNPNVSNLAKAFFKLNQVNYLEIMGDFENYKSQSSSFYYGEFNYLVKSSILRQFLNKFDIDCAIAEDRIEDALVIVNNAINEDIGIERPHTKSQLLHYKALIHSLKNSKKASEDAKKESLKLRKICGGNAFLILNHQILGISSLHIELFDEAMQHFKSANKIMAEVGGDYRWANVDAHLAYYWLRKKNKAKAKCAISDCLTYLRKNNLQYFFTWTPKVMEPVLAEAIKSGIEKAYALKLLKIRLKKGATENGKIVPLIQAKILKSKSDEHTTEFNFYISSLPSQQRQLLLKLFFSPKMKMAINELALFLWPEKEENKQRSSIDNLVSKLRQSIQMLNPLILAKDYIGVKGRIIYLQNWQIDGLDFLELTKIGKNFAKMKKYWQASNAFNKAFNLWGEPEMDSSIYEFSEEILDMLQHEYLRSVKIWSRILIEQNQKDKALAVSTKAFSLIPLETTLARQCYDLYAEKNDKYGCNYILKHYELAFRNIGESEDEIKIALEDFWNQD